MTAKVRIGAVAGITLLTGALLVAWLVATRAEPATANAADVEVFDVAGPFTKVIDVGAKGFGAGDSVLESHPLIDPETKERVGRAVTHVRIVRTIGKDDFLGIVDCTINLKNGKLVFYGSFRLSQVAGAGGTVPVTGGTGAYNAVGGAVTAKETKVGGKEGTLLSFDLTD